MQSTSSCCDTLRKTFYDTFLCLVVTQKREHATNCVLSFLCDYQVMIPSAWSPGSCWHLREHGLHLDGDKNFKSVDEKVVAEKSFKTTSFHKKL